MQELDDVITPRKILEKFKKSVTMTIDDALIDLDKYEEENKKSEQWILSRVEIDKDWIKKLCIDSKLLTEEDAERVAEGIKVYSPIKLVGEK